MPGDDLAVRKYADLYGDGFAADVHRAEGTGEGPLVYGRLPQAQRGSVEEDRSPDRVRERHRHQHGQGVRRPALFHQHRREPGIGGPRRQQRCQDLWPGPRVEVVNVGLDQQLIGHGQRMGHGGDARGGGVHRRCCRQWRCRQRSRPGWCVGRRSGTDDQADDVGPTRDVALAGTDADGRHPHCRQRTVCVRVDRHQSRSRRCAQLHVHRTAIPRHCVGTQQFQDSGAGDRQHAVFGAGRPAAERYRGRDQLVQAERVEPRADADHVGERVQRPDLVEVHLVGVDAMDDSLSLGERRKRG